MWAPPNWWNTSDADCSFEEMKDALEHSLGFKEVDEMVRNASRMLVSNKVTQ